ncbi:MAG: nucleotidyltransferase [Micromonosporaceae bacterium]|nr:nucleotidyltransferase [Micromonosporaceae bacterium]
MGDRGLDADGFIRREGSLDRIAAPFTGLVAELRARVRAAYPQKSLYVYGSLPRGAAVPGRSDLDAMVVLDREPTEADRAAGRDIEAALDDAHPVVDGVGILLDSRERLLSPAERHDGGFFVKCLCTPVFGEDLAPLLPGYRPTRRLARDTNGEIGEALARARSRRSDGLGPADRARLCRWLARKVTRTAFTLVMPRWGGWTSDMDLTHEVVCGYYPDWDAPLRRLIDLARTPSDAHEAVEQVLAFGDQVAAEYAAEIGVKPPSGQ